MRALHTIILWFILTAPFDAPCQNYNLKIVDSFAISVGRADSLSIPQLSYLLTDKYNDPVLKTRAIYTWIAHNIRYDCPAFHAAPKRKADPKDVFRLRKAVCAGYANLFMEMCNHAGVLCLTVDGYGRNGAEIIGEEIKEPNHTWNAVRIGKEWKMIDVTWASGYTDKKVKTFTPQFSDSYFFTDPNKFILNHYPKLASWKPSTGNLSKKEFWSNPTIMEGYFNLELNSFTPKKGVIKAKANEQISISFSTSLASQISSITAIIGEVRKEQVIKPSFTIDQQTASFTLAYEEAGSYPLTIYINNTAVFKYQLDIQ